jgi:hypothetical protein
MAETKRGTDGPEDAPRLEIGGFYRRDEISNEIGEDCSALSDAQLARYATQRLQIRVIYLDGFVGLVFLVKEKRKSRTEPECLSV